MDQDYNVKKKIGNETRTFGNIKKNQWNNYSLGMKVTPELKALIAENDGQWINFSLYPADKAKVAKPTTQDLDDTDSIPFAYLIACSLSGILLAMQYHSVIVT